MFLFIPSVNLMLSVLRRIIFQSGFQFLGLLSFQAYSMMSIYLSLPNIF
jgi:hypothetical protein